MEPPPPQVQVPQAPIPHALVLGNIDIAPGISNDESLVQILHWIGFRTAPQRAGIGFLSRIRKPDDSRIERTVF